MPRTRTTRRRVLGRAAGALLTATELLRHWPYREALAQTVDENGAIYWNTVALTTARRRPICSNCGSACSGRAAHVHLRHAWAAYDSTAVPTIPASTNLKRPF